MSSLFSLGRKLEKLKTDQALKASTSTTTDPSQDVIDELTKLVDEISTKQYGSVRWHPDVEEAEAAREVAKAKAAMRSEEEDNWSETSTTFLEQLLVSQFGPLGGPLVLAVGRVIVSLVRIEIGALLLGAAISIALKEPFTSFLWPAHLVCLALVLCTL